ncbi:hypothetical protein NEOLEDRAFT_1134812 [Neolentinus lepideus HHB14362 ss-1]|uniref:F-box domain-containing protein n=1 Tax=Neolentinus lepideus HHB14362 ss-1 TaxID=1314782 RepID=A0A165RZ16_9AGAM|nr:hypothetical protein NEOLEDRAFT_1134812 [Neolentinus lepideus HHB14362 ss-1]
MSALLHGYDPSPEDFARIHNEIQTHQRAISCIDEEMQALSRTMYALRERRTHHEAQIKRCKGFITWARRMPPEILARIFLHCVEDGWVQAPLIVSMVCLSWRFAARNYPRVWSHVHVNMEERDPISHTRYWLTMARQSPLHVAIVADIETSELSAVLDLLLEQASRWRSFSVASSSLRKTNDILSRCKKATPDLREISVTTDIEIDDVAAGTASLDGFQGSFQDAPFLKKIDLTSSTMHMAGFIPTQIEDLSIHMQASRRRVEVPISGSSILQMLEDLPNLKHFTLSLPPHHEPQYVLERDLARRIFLGNMETILLCVPPDVNGLMAHLITPKLRQLQIRSNLDPLIRPHDLTGASLRELLEQSNPPLELLELHDVDLTDDDYTHCLGVLDKLQELRLHESEISDHVIRLLSGPRGCCPRLSRLDLRWCGQLTGTTLVELVRSRLAVDDHPTVNSSVPIAEIAVMNCTFVEEQDVLDLATITVCRLILREREDYCRSRGCCTNSRYRQRLRLRHNIGYNGTGPVHLVL